MSWVDSPGAGTAVTKFKVSVQPAPLLPVLWQSSSCQTVQPVVETRNSRVHWVVVARDFTNLIAEMNSVLELALANSDSEKNLGATIALRDPINITTISNSIKVKPPDVFWGALKVCNSMPFVESWQYYAQLSTFHCYRFKARGLL